MLGVISSRRDCCASRRVGSGRSSKCYYGISSELIARIQQWCVLTRVVWRTLERRGKSLMPAWRVSMEESRILREDWRESTDAAREAAIVRGVNRKGVNREGLIADELCHRRRLVVIQCLLWLFPGGAASGKSGTVPSFDVKAAAHRTSGQTSLYPLLVFSASSPSPPPSPDHFVKTTTCHHVSPWKEIPDSRR